MWLDISARTEWKPKFDFEYEPSTYIVWIEEDSSDKYVE